MTIGLPVTCFLKIPQTLFDRYECRETLLPYTLVEILFDRLPEPEELIRDNQRDGITIRGTSEENEFYTIIGIDGAFFKAVDKYLPGLMPWELATIRGGGLVTAENNGLGGGGPDQTAGIYIATTGNNASVTAFMDVRANNNPGDPDYWTNLGTAGGRYRYTDNGTGKPVFGTDGDGSAYYYTGLGSGWGNGDGPTTQAEDFTAEIWLRRTGDSGDEHHIGAVSEPGHFNSTSWVLIDTGSGTRDTIQWQNKGSDVRDINNTSVVLPSPFSRTLHANVSSGHHSSSLPEDERPASGASTAPVQSGMFSPVVVIRPERSVMVTTCTWYPGV